MAGIESRDFLQGFPRIVTGEGRAWGPEQDPCRKWITPPTPNTLHPSSLASLAFALAVSKARPTLDGLLLSHARPFSSLVFLTTHREAISKSCFNLCRGSKAKSEDHASRPHHHLSGLSRHHLTSAPCSIPHIRPREGLLRCELQHVTLT